MAPQTGGRKSNASVDKTDSQILPLTEKFKKMGLTNKDEVVESDGSYECGESEDGREDEDEDYCENDDEDEDEGHSELDEFEDEIESCQTRSGKSYGLNRRMSAPAAPTLNNKG